MATTVGHRQRGVGFMVLAVVACLVAGLVVQSLVVWGITALGPTEREVPADRVGGSTVVVPRGVGLSFVSQGSYRGLHWVAITPLGSREISGPIAMADLPEWTDYPPVGSRMQHTTLAFGWPLPAWRGSWVLTRVHVIRSPPEWWERCLGLDRHPLGDVQAIPLNIFINSAFYGLFVVPLWRVGAKVRRAWRRWLRPGTCTHCGYALAGLPAAARCPECGRER